MSARACKTHRREAAFSPDVNPFIYFLISGRVLITRAERKKMTKHYYGFIFLILFARLYLNFFKY